MSEPDRLNFPYIECVKSFLPLCDEIIVVYNILKPDDGYDKLKNLDPKVKIIAGLFDYERFGWASQGIMRTNGYYASTGDIVLMSDCDAILHEKDIEDIRRQLTRIYDEKVLYGFWMKHRFNRKETYVRQCKHSGIYNKSLLGNSFNFYGHTGNYAPNWDIIPEDQRRGRQLEAYIYGYEKLWDDWETFKDKVEKSRIMQKSVHSNIPESKDFLENFMKEKREKTLVEGKLMSIDQQPKIIQEKLRQITPKMWGWSNFL
jgi:hypothetical protein